MQLPKHSLKRHAKKRWKLCAYRGCNKEFLGVPVQKYCDFHKDPRNRQRIRPKPESPKVKNQIFLHHFRDMTKVEFSCALPGCGEAFRVNVVPGIKVYPKYCEKHRTEFQRMLFAREKRLESAFIDRAVA